VFLNLDNESFNKNYKFKRVSENHIKLFSCFLLIFVLFIPPINSPNSVILWEEISPLNFIRAILAIISISYLPGANLYSLIFSKNDLPTKLKIDTLLLKITLYPLLSWSFVGFLVLILDQIGLVSNLIYLFLVISIFAIFLLDLKIKLSQEKIQISRVKTITIRKSTIIILALASGIALFSIGVSLGQLYLFGKDDWVSVSPAIYVGKLNLNPLSEKVIFSNNPEFWGYIIFGMSQFSGIPFINTNVFLAPFCYLFITSPYILFRIFLFKQKEIVAILATGLFAIFSGAFSIISTLYDYNISEFIIRMEFHFINKTFAYIAFFLALSLILFVFKGNFSNKTKNSKFINKQSKVLFLSAYLLILSFLSYMIPFLMGILLVLIFCIFYKKDLREENFKIFIQWLFYVISSLFIIDLITVFHFSSLAIQRFRGMFNFDIIQDLLGIIPYPIIFYLIFCSFLLFNYSLYLFFRKYQSKIKKISIKKNSNNLYKFFLVIFTIFVLIYLSDYIFTTIVDQRLEGFKIIIDLGNWDIISNDLKAYYINKVIKHTYLGLNEFYFVQLNMFFLDLYLFFTKIGLIGIIYMYLSYFCFKSRNERQSFKILFIWFIFSFIFALIPLNLQYLFDYNADYQLFYNDFFDLKKLLFYWYNRIWFYCFPSLCIFGAYGISKMFKKIRNNKFFKKREYMNLQLKLIAFSFITIISYSGIISTGMSHASTEGRYSDSTIEMVGWISENLPYGSNLLIDKNFKLKSTVRMMTMTYCNITFFEDVFDANSDPSQMEENIDLLKDHQIYFALINWEYLYFNPNYYNFCINILIPKFYTTPLHMAGNYVLYYAPLF